MLAWDTYCQRRDKHEQLKEQLEHLLGQRRDISDTPKQIKEYRQMVAYAEPIRSYRKLLRERETLRDLDIPVDSRITPELAKALSERSLDRIQEDRLAEKALLERYGSYSEVEFRHGTAVLICPSCQASVCLNQGKLQPVTFDKEDLSRVLSEWKKLRSRLRPLDYWPELPSQAQLDQYLTSQKLSKDRSELQRRLKSLAYVAGYAEGYSEDLPSRIEAYERQIQLRGQIERLELELNTLGFQPVPDPAPLSSLLTSTQHREIVQKLSGMVWVDPPAASSEQIRADREYWLVNQQRLEINLELETIRAKLPWIGEGSKVKSILEGLSKWHNQYLHSQTQYLDAQKKLAQVIPKWTQVAGRLEVIRLDPNWSTDWETNIGKLRDELGTAQELLREYEYSRSITQRLKKLDRDAAELDEISRDYESAQRIRLICYQIEQQRLETTLRRFNQVANRVSSRLFDDELQIELSSFKITKTTKQQRRQFDLKIYLRGIETTFEALSGGEQDRVSLCLILGLSSGNPSPLLMLDECLSSLNSEIKHRAVEAIRELNPDRTVICIDHDANPAWFDAESSLG